MNLAGTEVSFSAGLESWTQPRSWSTLVLCSLRASGHLDMPLWSVTSLCSEILSPCRGSLVQGLLISTIKKAFLGSH